MFYSASRARIGRPESATVGPEAFEDFVDNFDAFRVCCRAMLLRDAAGRRYFDSAELACDAVVQMEKTALVLFVILDAESIADEKGGRVFGVIIFNGLDLGIKPASVGGSEVNKGAASHVAAFDRGAGLAFGCAVGHW